jgi:hypothetical protein
MMFKRTMAGLAMGLALTTASSMAMAEEQAGWYFGVTGGQAQADLNQDELDEIVEDAFFSAGAPVLSGSSTLEDSDTSWSLFGGYRFSQYFGLEASYVDFGTAEYRASGTVNPPGPVGSAPASYAIDFEVTGFTVAAIGAIPLGQMFDLHARLGMLFADTEISERGTIGSVAASDSFSADSRDLHYGVGAGWHLGERWSLSLDWQLFKDVGDDEETGEADIDRVSLGVMFRL